MPVYSVCPLQATLVARWQAMDDAAKQHIMRALLATLPSDVSYCLQLAANSPTLLSTLTPFNTATVTC